MPFKKGRPGVSLALAALTAILPQACHRSTAERLASQLTARPFRGRLATDLPYLPVASNLPSAGAREVSAPPPARALRSLNDAEASPTSRDTATIRLLLGRGERALSGLRRALLDGDPDAELLNDLAVAELGLYDQRHDPQLLLSALEHVARARELEPSSAAVLFNFALIAFQVPLPYVAAEAVAAHAEVEDDPRWLEEAAALGGVQRDPLEAFAEISARLLDPHAEVTAQEIQQAESTFPYELRTLAERQLLAALGEELLARRIDDAEQLETRLRRIADWLRDETGNPLVGEALDAMGRDDLRRARAHIAYSAGMEAYEARDFREANRRLDEARRLFEASGSPFSLLARLHLGILLWFDESTEGCADLEALLGEPAVVRYPSLEADLLWMRGTCHTRRRRHQEALVAYRRSKELHETASGPQRAAQLDTMISETLDARGEREEAWRHRLAGLHAAIAEGPRRRHAALQVALTNLAAHERFVLAQVFATEALENARHWGAPETIAETSAALGRLALARGNPQEADRLLTSAEDTVREMDSLRDLRDAIHLQHALVLASEDPDASLGLLEDLRDDAISSLQNQVLLHETRGIALHTLGREDEAKQVLLEGLDLYEELVADAPTLTARLAAYTSSRRLYDRLLTWSTRSANDPRGALALLERSRARYLLDLWAPNASQELDDIARALEDLSYADVAEPTRAVLSLAVVDGRIWLVALDRRGLRTAWSPLSADQVDRATTRLWSEIEIAGAWRESAGELYDALVEPVDLGRPQRLVIVPDGPLAEIPYALLADGTSGELLIERSVVSLAPSLRLAALMNERAAAFDGAALSVTTVNDPLPAAPDAALAPLPLAAEEAERVRALYAASSRGLSGAEATIAALLENRPRNEVLHYAGHASAADDARSSTLQLSPDGEEDGRLSVERLLEAGPLYPRLVVLSACSSATDAREPGSTVFGLASGFLAGQAAAVVATLRPVGDQATLDLMVRFHRRFLELGDAAAALRDATLSMPRIEDAAPFLVLGQ